MLRHSFKEGHAWRTKSILHVVAIEALLCFATGRGTGTNGGSLDGRTRVDRIVIDLQMLLIIIQESLACRRIGQLGAWQMASEVACFAHVVDLLVVGARASQLCCLDV